MVSEREGEVFVIFSYRADWPGSETAWGRARAAAAHGTFGDMAVFVESVCRTVSGRHASLLSRLIGRLAPIRAAVHFE